MSNFYKIYRYIDPEDQPQNLSKHPGSIIFPDQLNRNLPKRTDIILGERRRTTYFDRYENDQFIEPIIEINYHFERDQQGLVFEKMRSIAWMLESEAWSEETQVDYIPVVGAAEKLAEIKRRRYNIISELKGLAKKFSTAENQLERRILEIFEENQLLINTYIDAGSSKFRNAIQNSDQAWLDVVIPATGNKSRDVLTQYLSIGLVQ